MPAVRLQLITAKAAWTAAALALAATVGLLDYVTGADVSLTIFYVLPIWLATWKGGLGAGLFVSLASALIWFLADYLWKAPYSNALIPYWNALMRLGFFLLTVFLIGRTKMLNLSLEHEAGSLARQIAERQRAEQALAENQKMFQLITENASDLIAVLDLKGQRLYSSPSSRQLLAQETALDGGDYFTNVVPEDREQVRAVYLQAIATGSNQRAEYRVASQHCLLRYLESEWSVIREPDGQPRSVLVVSRDVSSRKRMELLYANEKELLEMIAQGKPLEEVLRKLVQKVTSWSTDIFCSILAEDPDQNPVLHVASTGLGQNVSAKPQDDPQLGRHLEPVKPVGDGAVGEGRPALLDTEWRQYRAAALEAGLQIVYSKPVLSTLGDSLGSLSIYAREAENSEATRLQLFSKIAHVTSIAMERQRSERTLRRLSSLILNAQEAERRRLARELHDGVSQILSSAAFRVESILEDLPAENESLQREVAKVRFLMKKAGQEVRRISENLRPSELDELGLVPAVRDLCEDFRERTQLSVQLLAPTPERFSSDLELALYRVVQEALTNIEKHASASEVILRLSWDEAFVTLQIRDNGKGLTSGPKEGGPRKRLGMGLVDMKERCAFLGGGLSIRSEPGTGTEIAARIPRTAARAESVA